MKKYLLIISLGLAQTAMAQDNSFPINGNVGLGVSAPVEKLDVNGNVVWNGYNSGNPRGAKIGFSGGNYGGIGYNIDYTPSTGLFNRPLNDATSYLQFTNGGFQFFGTHHGPSANGIGLTGGGANLNLFATMTNTGDFGIGTNPEAKLDVNGSTLIRGNVKLANSRNAYMINYVSLSEANGGASTIIGNNVVAGTAENSIKKTISVYDVGSFVCLNYYNGITFHTGVTGELNVDKPVSNSEKMRITQTGNLLIGKASQNNPAYILDVNGKARANEIVVNTSGADFVFEKDYKLPTLSEVEAFIKEKKHLPEIPTASEMAENGVSLGELNIKLLQKVEELTLHLIEKDKALKQEQAKNQSQDDRISRLEALMKIKK